MKKTTNMLTASKNESILGVVTSEKAVPGCANS
jgi:hypothetical protein